MEKFKVVGKLKDEERFSMKEVKEARDYQRAILLLCPSYDHLSNNPEEDIRILNTIKIPRQGWNGKNPERLRK